MKLLISLAVAGVLIAPTTSGAARPAYLGEDELSQAFQEDGITLGGKHRSVLEAVCSGTGRPRGVYPYQRFHIFECYVRSSGQRGAVPPRYRVTTVLDKPNHITYWYERIPGV